MKINKKITSAALAIAMIASSFSGMLPIGGNLSAGAEFWPIMNGQNDYVFTMATSLEAMQYGNVQEITSVKQIPSPTDPKLRELWVQLRGKVNQQLLTAESDLHFKAYDLTGAGLHGIPTAPGSSHSVEYDMPETRRGYMDITTGEFWVNMQIGPWLNLRPVNGFENETTIQIRMAYLGSSVSNQNMAAGDCSSLNLNIKSTKVPDAVNILVPPDKATAQVDVKTNLTADDIPAATKELGPNALLEVKGPAIPGADVPNPGPYNIGDITFYGVDDVIPNSVIPSAPTVKPALPKDGVSIKADNTAIVIDEKNTTLPVTFLVGYKAIATPDYKAISEPTQSNITIAKGKQTLAQPLTNNVTSAAGTLTIPTYTSAKIANIGTRKPVVLGQPDFTNIGTLKNVALNGTTLTWTPDVAAAGTITIPVTIAEDEFYEAYTGQIVIDVRAKPAQTVSFGTSPTEAIYDGANNTTKLTATATPTGIAANTAPGAISYAITQGGNVATIDATTGLISWTGGYGPVTVQATAAGTNDSAESTGTHTITRRKAELSLTSKNPRVNTKGPASIDTLVGSTVKAGDTLSALNQYNVTYKLKSDTSAEIALDFAADKNLTPGEYSFTVTPKTAETTNYITTAGTAGTFTVSNASTDDDSYVTVFYDVGANGTITSGTSSEQVIQGGTPRHIPTVKGITGFEHTGWSLNGTVVDPSTIVVNNNVTFKAVYNGVVVKPEIPSDLAFNKELKVPYIKGDPDGKFRPESSITRAEYAAIISRVLNRTMPKDQSTKTNFSDVASNAWYAKEVAFVESLGIINGYDDGTFRPHDSITRAEVTTIVMRVERFKDEVISPEFKDIKGNWAEKAIDAAYKQKIINGYPDGTFRPDNKITRAEAVTLMNNVLNIKSVEARAVFTDIMGHWAAPAITAAATLGSKK